LEIVRVNKNEYEKDKIVRAGFTTTMELIRLILCAFESKEYKGFTGLNKLQIARIVRLLRLSREEWDKL
jgi:hypothetical protein